MSNNSILVVGGGFAGITAALEAAEVGHEVFIIEKNPYLGGRVAQLNQYFPKLCPPTCGLEIQFQRIRNNPLVKVRTMAELVSISGTPGNYIATVKIVPRYVNEKCTACGECEKAASTTMENEFEFGLCSRKAVYKPHVHAFPMRYVLDAVRCDKAELAKIKAACPYDAIDLDDQEKIIEIPVGSVVMATGWKPYDVKKLTNLGGGHIKNVITNMQLERLAAPAGPTEGKILRPSDKKAPKKIAFVQCAGSRDENHLNYCSYICCMASLKHAAYIRARDAEAEVVIYYIDLRTPGRYENFKNRILADSKLKLVKGKVAEIVEDHHNRDVVVTVEDAVTGIKSREHFDLVVLATGMQPSVAGQKLGLKVPQDEQGFIIGGEESGFIPSGCAKMPLDVMKSAQTGTGAALRAIQSVSGR